MKNLKSFIAFLVFVVLIASVMSARRVSSQSYSPSESILAAGPWYVSPGGNDGNDCLAPATPCATINAAIGKANPGDTIIVENGIYSSTSGVQVVLLDKSLLLSGGWNSGFTVQDGFSTVDGQGTRLGMLVGNYVDATVEHFTIQNGKGGIQSYSSNLYVLASNIVNNTYLPGDSGNEGGGILVLGGTLSLIDSTVSGNAARSGGGISNSGTMTITNSTISDNTAGQTGVGSNTGGGGIRNEGTLIINNSTISGNTLLGDFLGSGIYFNLIGGLMSINNSTISGNTNGDGIYAMGIVGVEDGISINSSTISNNQQHGLTIDGGFVTMKNTIIANNEYGDCYIWHSGIFTSLGYNLIFAPGACTPTITDLVGLDPKLDVLVGDPSYHPLLTGSPAIDSGNPAGCTDHLGNPLITDQRGAPRPQDGNGDGVPVCDIGSYEVESSPSVPPSQVGIFGLNEGVVGESYPFIATVDPVSTTLPISYTWQASGQVSLIHSSALSDTVAYTWDSPGTQAITVTATNYGGIVTDTHAIHISEVAISGLVASSNSPTLLGAPTTFTATVEEGTNVTYAWDFGDDTAGVGATLMHTYSATGAYTATVTASNSTGSMQTSTVVTIIDVPITGLVAISDSPTIMGVPTTVTAIVEAGTNISYTWDFGDDAVGEGVVVTHTYSAVGVYTATVTASNSVGNMQASTVVDVVTPETRVYLPLLSTAGYIDKSAERAALMALYTSTSGDGWRDNTGWGTNAPHCDWYGVTCEENGHVTILDLDQNILTGTIPSEIGNLPILTALRLTGTDICHDTQAPIPPPPECDTYQLSGSLPPEIGNLTNLQTLDLRYNKITLLPAEIGSLANLQILNLDSNKLSTLPPEIGNLVNLQELSLVGNQLTSLPPEIGNLASLGMLDLGVNQLISLPPEFGALVNLEYFDLGANYLASLPAEIGNLVNLEELHLGGNQLTSLPPEIGNLARLQILDLVYNRLISLPPEIGNLASLQVLDLFLNRLIGPIPAYLSNLGSLYELMLEQNPDLTCWETEEALDWALSLEFYYGPTCYLP